MLAPDRSLKAIYVENLDAVMDKMKKMDADLQKEFRKELNKAVKPVAKLAKSFVPYSPFPGWRDVEPSYPPAWGWANDQVHRGTQSYHYPTPYQTHRCRPHQDATATTPHLHLMHNQSDMFAPYHYDTKTTYHSRHDHCR